MIKIDLKNIIKLIVFQQLVLTGHAQAQINIDPVVISYGDIQITRRQFEEQFEMAMVMKALETGVPIKNQDQIYIMEHRFIEQRAKEMVLLDVARQEGITVSATEQDEMMTEYMLNMGFTEYSDKNLHRLGFVDKAQLTGILSEKLMISKLISRIKSSLGSDQKGSSINAVIAEYYARSGIKIYPERIDTPYTSDSDKP